MGTPKQLLRIQGSTLLQRTIRAIRESGVVQNTIVVLGSNAAAHLEAIGEEPVKTVVNQDWASGMGSSIHCGLNALDPDQLPDAILITVCDQPLLDASVIRELHSNGRRDRLAVCDYGNGAMGTPVLAGFEMLSHLRNLPKDSGLRKIFPAVEQKLIRVAFPGGAIDLDTPEDYQSFVQGI